MVVAVDGESQLVLVGNNAGAETVGSFERTRVALVRSAEDTTLVDASGQAVGVGVNCG